MRLPTVLEIVAGIAATDFGLFLGATAMGDLKAKADTIRMEAPHEPVGQVFQAPEITLTPIDSKANGLSASIKKSAEDKCSQSVADVYYNRSRIYLKCLQDELAPHGYMAEFTNEDELYIILNTNDAKQPTQ